jgi:hypothetical protein
MKDLIYFPYFEPQNDKWLKFSLLYVDEFRPIIPYNRKEDISDLYKQIMEETDLVKSYSPDYAEGSTASQKTIDEIEYLLANIQNKNYLFDYRNLFESIQNNRNYLIYREKFSYEFEQYCSEKNLADKHDNGLYLSEELAYVFMTNLAKEISYKTNSSIITDSNKFQNYSNSKRILNQNNQQKMNLAENIIDLKLPKNIDQIEFNKLIKFREKNRTLLKVFNNELDKISDADINDITTYNFLQNYNEIYIELMKKIAIFGIAGASIPFSIYTLFNDNDISTFDYTKEMTSAIGGISGIGFAIKDVMKDTKEKRQTIKYFANLEKIG